MAARGLGFPRPAHIYNQNQTTDCRVWKGRQLPQIHLGALGTLAVNP